MSTALPETELSYSYEHAIDIDVSDDPSTPEWQRIRFIHSLDPQDTPITVEAGTYEDLGSPSPRKTGENWTVGFYVQAHTVAGEYLPEVKALRAATQPDALGNDSQVAVRWYDNPAPGTREPVLDEAYSGLATVQMVRAATGANGDIAGWNVTLTGVGRRAKAAHPGTTTP